MKTLHKLFQTQVASINEEEKSVEFVISTDQVDRYGDVVDQDSWDFKAYLDNPIVLWGHDPSEPENVLGGGSQLTTYTDGGIKKTKAKLTFATDINAKAALVWSLIKAGILRTVSVGFRNAETEFKDDIAVLKGNELFEISVVPIPANSGAVALSLKDGSIHEKDAKWLVETMRKETELLEKQLKTNDKEKSMTEETAQALVDNVAKLSEKLDSLAEENKTLREEIAALKPAEETEEEKTAREAQEAADAETARKAKEEANKPPAKSGDNDQDGAGEDDDDFDPEAEITPELQAQIDAELEAAHAA